LGVVELETPAVQAVFLDQRLGRRDAAGEPPSVTVPLARADCRERGVWHGVFSFATGHSGALRSVAKDHSTKGAGAHAERNFVSREVIGRQFLAGQADPLLHSGPVALNALPWNLIFVPILAHNCGVGICLAGYVASYQMESYAELDRGMDGEVLGVGHALFRI
jgi:hypothetical protein